MSFKVFQAFLHHERSWTVRVTVLVLLLVALLCVTTIFLVCALAGHETSLALATALLDTGAAGLTLFIVLAVCATLACMGLLAWVIGAVLRHEEQRDAEQGQMELLLEAMEERVVQKNNELKELSRRALLLLDATNSGIMAVDREGHVTFANAMAQTLTGHDKDEVLGSVLHDILHPTDANTAPLSREHCPVCHAIREATETRFELLRLCRKDGSALLVNGAVSPLREDGELTGAVVIFHDVGTPRQTELWRRTFFKHTGESILVWDGRHRLVDANLAFCNMVGYGCLADVQEHFASLHGAKQPCGLPWRQALRYLFSCCERDGSVLSRWIFRHRDGREIPCEGHIVYMTGPLGVCYFTIMHDISHNLAYEAHLKQNIAEINELRVAAEASAVAKGEFLARMSHEIRTPMNAIIGMSHLLLATRLDAQQQHYLGSIRHAATNLLGILNDILDISKIEGGHLELEAAPFALREHVGNTLALFALMAQKKNLELLCYIQPDVPDMLVGDHLRLTQILGNLLNNAIKFTERGSVRLDIFLAQREGQTVTLRGMVQDTGVGMTEEQLGKLFQPFQQADASISRRYGGTGLGLAITRSLVERMGGTIEARSESGQGSAFVFDVKLALDKAAPASDWHASFNDVRSLLRGQRVLVDTPLPEFARMVRAMLGDLGLPCACVNNTADGIALVREDADGRQPINVAILDGDFARTKASSAMVIQQLQGACLPTILVTPAFSREHYEHARDWPAQANLGLLTKPFDQVSLGNALAQTLGLRDSSQKDRPSLPRAFAKTALAGARVLLVEDNDINQEVALALLEDVGVVAKLARDGAEAVELCREQAFDLVLMDIRMPVMDGIEATSTIRGLPVPWAATMPILALTADAMNEERERALASGMDDYITKPIEPEILFAKMGAWLGNASHE